MTFKQQKSDLPSGYIHCWEQRGPGDPVKLIGTRRQLELLQKALNEVLGSTKETNRSVAKVTAADGDCYPLVIELRKEDEDVDEVPYDAY